jgi:outer membrane protein assembly factor BamB
LRRYPAEQPVGRTNSAWGGVHVAIHRGLVIAPLEDRLYGLNLQTGEVWPNGEATQPLAQAPLAKSGQIETGVMPYDGQMQHSVSVADGRVAMRSGAIVSGWLPVMRPRGGASQLLVVDLEREGELLPGYPLQGSTALSSIDSNVASSSSAGAGSVVEFEGAPLLVGERLYVGITQRDDAMMTTAVRCYDVASGVQLFQTPMISGSRPMVTDSGQRSGQNRVARGLVSYREGTLYYHGDGGAIAAIDAETGQLRWCVRYSRAELSEAGYQRRRRGARRECSPIALLGPLAIVGPADMDRLLALDAVEGRLVWATSPGVADDCHAVLGISGANVIAGGDRLYWINRDSGSITATWPAGSTPQSSGALPQPRGVGRGLLAGDAVYWPTADAVWVLGAKLGESLGESVVVPQRRIELAGWGLEGGNLAAADGWLVIAGRRGIAAFRSHGVE